MRIREVIAAKADPSVVTVAPHLTVRELVALLAEHNLGALVVTSGEPGPGSAQGPEVIGIVSERDVVRRLHSDPALLDARVESIMTTQVQTCASADDLDAVMAVMTQQRIRHLPVLDGGRMVGIVSIGDVVKHKIDALQFERDQLDSYLSQS